MKVGANTEDYTSAATRLHEVKEKRAKKKVREGQIRRLHLLFLVSGVTFKLAGIVFMVVTIVIHGTIMVPEGSSLLTHVRRLEVSIKCTYTHHG